MIWNCQKFYNCKILLRIAAHCTFLKSLKALRCIYYCGTDAMYRTAGAGSLFSMSDRRAGSEAALPGCLFVDMHDRRMSRLGCLPCLASVLSLWLLDCISFSPHKPSKLYGTVMRAHPQSVHCPEQYSESLLCWSLIQFILCHRMDALELVETGKVVRAIEHSLGAGAVYCSDQE